MRTGGQLPASSAGVSLRQHPCGPMESRHVGLRRWVPGAGRARVGRGSGARAWAPRGLGWAEMMGLISGPFGPLFWASSFGKNAIFLDFLYLFVISFVFFL